jgi:hypothetical protein
MHHLRLSTTVLRVSLSAAALLLAAPPVFACSVCACGDPLRDATGPAALESRLAFGLEAETLDMTAASEEVPGADEKLRQSTLRLRVSARPSLRWAAFASVPLVRKEVRTAGVQDSDVTGLGDVELGAQVAVWDRTSFSHRSVKMLSLTAGSAFPTGEANAKVDGERLDAHSQPGTGAFGPFAGLNYRLAFDSWHLAAGLSGRAWTTGPGAFQYGPAVVWSLHGQVRLAKRFAAELGFDARHAAPDREEGAAVENTGGTVIALAPSVYWNAAGQVWIEARAQVPVLERLRGDQSTGPVYVVGMRVEVF